MTIVINGPACKNSRPLVCRPDVRRVFLDEIMRQLSLHASALNDAEYELYTSCLRDLAWTDETDGEGSSPTSGHDDAYFERIRIGVRELRGWMRGRYAHVAPASLDGVRPKPEGYL